MLAEQIEALSHTPEPEWRIGDQVLAAIAAGELPLEARRETARLTRRELPDITMIVRVCAAFPADRRRSDLTFGHHEGASKLPEPDRSTVLASAAQRGLSARQLRREVLAARVASGDVFQLSDDDPEDREYVKLVRAWNHASLGAREMFAGSIEDADGADIPL